MLNITRIQAKWILQSYAPIRGHGRIDKHKAVILETLSILRGQPVTISCNCELGAISAAEPVIENEGSNEEPKAKGKPRRKV
jgi:hypothetical protein